MYITLNWIQELKLFLWFVFQQRIKIVNIEDLYILMDGSGCLNHEDNYIVTFEYLKSALSQIMKKLKKII